MFPLALLMGSSGVPGAIQITGSAVALLGDAYVWEARGSVDVKGKGPLDTFLLVGRRGETNLRAGG
jgi:adenylate cyclase